MDHRPDVSGQPASDAEPAALPRKQWEREAPARATATRRVDRAEWLLTFLTRALAPARIDEPVDAADWCNRFLDAARASTRVADSRASVVNEEGSDLAQSRERPAPDREM